MRTIVLACALFSVTLQATAQPRFWAGSWASSQQIPEARNALAPDDLRDATLRQMVHLSVGGSRVRVHLSNAFGAAQLHLTSVHIARPVANTSPAIQIATDRALTFHGSPDVTIPAGSEYFSDPIDYGVNAGADLTISLHFDQPPDQQTGHPGSRATSYLVHGDAVSAPDLANAKKVEHWYQLAGVDVATAAEAASIVVLGDSITDGHGATTDGNDRWPDVLARRMPRFGVLNEGIGGNHLLSDGLGPSALARFDRDVLAQTGVQFVMVLEGVNDLGGLARMAEVGAEAHSALVQRVIAAYEQLIARAHGHRLRIIGCTILPYLGSAYYHPGAASEADRQAVNTWIRAAGHFDAVVDFDRVMTDPDHPGHLRTEFDSGDHLHPSPAGYAAMANAVPLAVFRMPRR